MQDPRSEQEPRGKVEIKKRYEEALDRAGIRDVQPAYRHLLRALKTIRRRIRKRFRGYIGC